MDVVWDDFGFRQVESVIDQTDWVLHTENLNHWPKKKKRVTLHQSEQTVIKMLRRTKNSIRLGYEDVLTMHTPMSEVKLGGGGVTFVRRSLFESIGIVQYTVALQMEEFEVSTPLFSELFLFPFFFSFLKHI